MVLWRLKGVSAGDREKIKNKSLNKEENGGDNDQLKQLDDSWELLEDSLQKATTTMKRKFAFPGGWPASFLTPAAGDQSASHLEATPSPHQPLG